MIPAIEVEAVRRSFLATGQHTPAAVPLHEQNDALVHGPEHYHAQLMSLSEAAVPVFAGEGGDDCRAAAVVVVLCHLPDQTSLQLPLARMLVARVTDRLADHRERQVTGGLRALPPATL
ncbi:MAG TPA: hypothetical protein VGN81_27495 [Pseudonocardiaceae bacterium]